MTHKKTWDQKDVHTVSLSNCYVFEKGLHCDNTAIPYSSSLISSIQSEPDKNVDWLYLLYHINRYKKWCENMEIKPIFMNNQYCLFQSLNGEIHLYEFILQSTENNFLRTELILSCDYLFKSINNIHHFYNIYFDKLLQEINRYSNTITELSDPINCMIEYTNTIRKQINELIKLKNKIESHKTKTSIGLVNQNNRIKTVIISIYDRLSVIMSNIEIKLSCAYFTHIQYKDSVNFFNKFSLSSFKYKYDL